MKKIIVSMLLALLFVGVGANVAVAKEKDKVETVVYALTPAPTCQNCVNKIKGNLRFEKGVKAVNVDLKTKSVSITYLPKATTQDKLVAALKKIGYTASAPKAKTPAK